MNWGRLNLERTPHDVIRHLRDLSEACKRIREQKDRVDVDRVHESALSIVESLEFLS
jgi:hypothetical protein